MSIAIVQMVKQVKEEVGQVQTEPVWWYLNKGKAVLTMFIRTGRCFDNVSLFDNVLTMFICLTMF